MKYFYIFINFSIQVVSSLEQSSTNIISYFISLEIFFIIDDNKLYV